MRQALMEGLSRLLDTIVYGDSTMFMAIYGG
jgi:hypothetical protein